MFKISSSNESGRVRVLTALVKQQSGKYSLPVNVSVLSKASPLRSGILTLKGNNLRYKVIDERELGDEFDLYEFIYPPETEQKISSEQVNELFDILLVLPEVL